MSDPWKTQEGRDSLRKWAGYAFDPEVSQGVKPSYKSLAAKIGPLCDEIERLQAALLEAINCLPWCEDSSAWDLEKELRKKFFSQGTDEPEAGSAPRA